LVAFISFFSSRNIRAPSADRREILHDILGAAFNFIIPVQNFVGASQKNLGAKTCKIWPDFGRLQSSAANISGTEKDIENR